MVVKSFNSPKEALAAAGIRGYSAEQQKTLFDNANDTDQLATQIRKQGRNPVVSPTTSTTSDFAALKTKAGILAVLTTPIESIRSKIGGVEKRYIVYKMLQAMYARQTADERSSHVTKHTNGIGFNMMDAQFLTSVAKNSQQYKNLTDKQAVSVAKCLRKYIGQLVEIANIQ